MKFSTIIKPDSIELNVRVEDKTQMIDQLISLLVRQGVVDDLSLLRNAVFEREDLMSTGIGKGFALPHAKTNSIADTACSLITLAKPIEYDSIDNQPVNIACLLVGKESNVGLHLRFLSRISKLMSNDSVRGGILGAHTPEEVCKILIDNED